MEVLQKQDSISYQTGRTQPAKIPESVLGLEVEEVDRGLPRLEGLGTGIIFVFLLNFVYDKS